ncbi:hypothetical protein B0H66DRAFT_568903 [Apodospora peruviana]|uniref:Rhodopsin domain-containing protein n=1 Tax=Apodospora peruviana TaxID=516989 RepID=A0AAE0HVM0_9PEZI|nr:hypothetical protein B0H66DRAFT_568903 [Apodospora peruviana]
MDDSFTAVGLQDLSQALYLGLGASFLVLSAAFVATRLTVNLKKAKKLLIEDAASIFAVVLLAASYALDIESMNALFDPNVTTKKLHQVILVFNVIVSFAMWSSKVPILLLYIRLFGLPTTWLRIISYSTIATTFLLFLSGVAITGQACTVHPGEELTKDLLAVCMERGNLVGFGLGFVALATDVVILAIPLPVLASLKIPFRKKVGLFVIFLAGVVAIVAGITSSYYKWLSTTHKTAWNLKQAMLCRVLECCIAVIVGCVPTTYAFWKTYIADFAIYSRLRRLLGLTGKTTTPAANNSDTCQIWAGPRGQSGDRQCRNDPEAQECRIFLAKGNSMSEGKGEPVVLVLREMSGGSSSSDFGKRV